MTRIKLTYTDEMKRQDKLWSMGKEDFDHMGRFQKKVVDEAKGVGWEGYVVFPENDEQTEVHIASTKNDYKKGNYVVLNNCKQIIRKIESDLFDVHGEKRVIDNIYT